MSNIKAVFQSMRAPFLLLTFACVFLGASLVSTTPASINLPMLALALLGALLAHISVNTLNEYLDYKSGLDLETLKTPFSGGSGALPQHPEMQYSVLAVGSLSLLSVFLIGGFFIWQYDATIIPVGLLGLIIIATYTDHINRRPFLCLIAPGTGFGLLMVAGTQFVLLGEYLPLTWLAGLVPFFLVNNLLLLNQYPDIVADRKVGRNHFPIAFGITASNLVYGLFAVATVVTIITLVLTGMLPMLALIALLPMPLAFFSLSGAVKYRDEIGHYPQYLAANVAVTLLTTTLLAVALVFG